MGVLLLDLASYVLMGNLPPRLIFPIEKIMWEFSSRTRDGGVEWNAMEIYLPDYC